MGTVLRGHTRGVAGYAEAAPHRDLGWSSDAGLSWSESVRESVTESHSTLQWRLCRGRHRMSWAATQRM